MLFRSGMATDPEDPNTISLPRPPVAAIPTIPPRMQAVTTEPALPNWFVQNATQTAAPPIATETPPDSAPENPDMKGSAPTPALPDQPLLQQPGAQADLPDLAIASQAPDGAIPAVPAIGVHQTHATPLSTATIPTGHFLPPTLAADLHAIIARRADGPVELSLAPAELGRLHVSLLQDGDILRVVIRAERGETLDLLRRNADSLMQEIRSAGFAGGSFSFSGWTGGQPPAPQAGLFGAGPTADSGQQAAAPPTPEMRPARSGLDLRL